MSSSEHEIQEWEIKFRNYLTKNSLVSGYVNDNINKIIEFLKHNYIVLNNDSCWYDDKYVDALNKEIGELRKILDLSK